MTTTETTASAAPAAPAKVVSKVEASAIQRVTYEDGSSELTSLCLAEPDGIRIIGGGTIPSPLSVEVLPGWRLIREEPATPRNPCSSHRDNPSPRRSRPECDTCNRLEIEADILARTVRALIADGYLVSLNDGDETTVTDSSNAEELIAAAFTTDEDRLYARKPDGGRQSWIWFVYGNSGYDVISDYTTDLEEVLRPILSYADTLEG